MAPASHPLVYLRELEPQQTSSAVRRKALHLHPAVDGVLVDAEVRSHLLNVDPPLISAHETSALIYTDENR
jgi:hypothetical protein